MDEEIAYRGLYFDGRNAVGINVSIELEPGGLTLTASGKGDLSEIWPYENLYSLNEDLRRNEICIGSELCKDAQLIVQNPHLIELLKKSASTLDSTSIEKRNWATQTALYGCLATVISVLFYLSFPFLAQWSVPLIPLEAERSWGVGLAESILSGEEKICQSSKGQRALGLLVSKLEAQSETPHPLELRVLVAESVNAFALPGGQIFISSQLIEEAETSDELAGVLAHEVGHVVKRHSMIGLFETFLIEMVFGSTVGGGVPLGFDIGSLTVLSYSRDMEREADSFAVELLEKTDIQSGGLIRFFNRLQKTNDATGEPIAFLSTHPSSQERAQAVPTDRGEAPALSKEEWAALKQICRSRG